MGSDSSHQKFWHVDCLSDGPIHPTHPSSHYPSASLLVCPCFYGSSNKLLSLAINLIFPIEQHPPQKNFHMCPKEVTT